MTKIELFLEDLKLAKQKEVLKVLGDTIDVDDTNWEHIPIATIELDGGSEKDVSEKNIHKRR